MATMLTSFNAMISFGLLPSKNSGNIDGKREELSKSAAHDA